HRTSADHDDRYYTKSQADDRYYTKSQVDNLVASSGLQWIEPGNTVLASSLSEASTGVWGTWSTLKRFVVFNRPGRYRITGEFRRDSPGVGSVATVRVRAGGLSIGEQSTTSTSWQSFSFDTPSNVFLGTGDVIVVEGQADEGARCAVRNVRVCCDVCSPPPWAV